MIGGLGPMAMFSAMAPNRAENIAIGPNPAIIHAGWMDSPGMNDRGIRADGDVLRDGTEPRAGFGKAAFQVGLAGELVLEPIQIGHAESMLAGGFEEGVIPLECGKAL